MLEPLSISLPGGLVVIPTLVGANISGITVEILNFFSGGRVLVP